MVAVKWCEAEVRSFEWTNTFSNLIFAITAYVGWRLAKERGLPFEFVAAELLLIVVFVGSVLFHGTAGASWRAELLDELPMMLLAHAYLWSVRDIHPWTRPPLWGRTLFVGAGVPIVGAVTYVWWQNYAVFINTLTCVAGVSSMAWGQTHFFAGGIAFSASRKIGAPLRTWFWFIGTFAFGKIIWEIEQYRYREGTSASPVYWFHAGWRSTRFHWSRRWRVGFARAPLIRHRRDSSLTQAAAHHAAMRFHGELWVATRETEESRRRCLDTVAAMHLLHSIVPGGLLVTSKRTSAICGSAALMAAAMSSQISKGTR